MSYGRKNTKETVVQISVSPRVKMSKGIFSSIHDFRKQTEQFPMATNTS